MAVVTLPEFQNYMSGTRLSEVQVLSAQAILDGVQSELETYLNRAVQQRRVRETVAVSHNGYAHVSNSPIIALYGVYRVNPVTGETGTTRLELPYGAWSPGQNMIRVGYAATSMGPVSVDYLGGENGDKIPGLKLAIMRVAAREFAHNHDDGMSIQNTELRPPEDPTPVAKGWTVEELAKFDRFRRRVVR